MECRCDELHFEVFLHGAQVSYSPHPLPAHDIPAKGEHDFVTIYFAALNQNKC